MRRDAGEREREIRDREVVILKLESTGGNAVVTHAHVGGISCVDAAPATDAMCCKGNHSCTYQICLAANAIAICCKLQVYLFYTYSRYSIYCISSRTSLAVLTVLLPAVMKAALSVSVQYVTQLNKPLFKKIK